MKQYKYFIIGGGLAGDAATRGIRELDGDGSIGLISQEPDPPYMRPNLSKGLWKGRPVEKIWRSMAAGECHLDGQGEGCIPFRDSILAIPVCATLGNVMNLQLLIAPARSISRSMRSSR